MKKIFFLASLFGILCGCAQTGPAKATTISNGVYRIEAAGKASSPIETLERKVETKAKVLCSQGFEYQGKGALRSDDFTTNYKGAKKKSKYVEYARVVECK